MRKRLLVSTIPVSTGAALALATLATPASVAAATTNTAVSENWAGYVATSQSGKSFSAASGAWTEPSVSCTAGNTTYSAYWVGLGGGSSGSDALEQEGTQADCTSSGQAVHYAWYELVPSAPVKINMKISAGDSMYARTSVSGDQVTVEVDDHTTGATFKKTLTMSTTPDVSTAEWIAEAPSECQSSTLSNCQVLSLANFGQVKFTDAHATAGGHTGSISDSQFSATAVGLGSSSSSFYGSGSGGYGYTDPSSSGSQSSTSGYGSTGSGWGDSGWGDGSAGGYSSGGYSDPYGGYGFTRARYNTALADTSMVSASGSAAPSSLSDDGTAFTVYYGKALSGASTSSLTSSDSSGSDSSGLGSSSSGSSGSWGYGSSGYGSSGSDGYGSSGYGSSGYGSDGYGSSGYGSSGYGSSGYGSDGSGSYTISIGGNTFTISGI